MTQILENDIKRYNISLEFVLIYNNTLITLTSRRQGAAIIA